MSFTCHSMPDIEAYMSINETDLINGKWTAFMNQFSNQRPFKALYNY